MAHQLSPTARANAALRHSQTVSGIAQRHLELMNRVRDTYEPGRRDAFFRANPAAIKEGWKSLGTIQDTHREFDEALR